MTVHTIALVGNPNCGKTTLFNKLTGSQQKIGNWAGVTVERKEGRLWLEKNAAITVVDLPGVYSLTVSSADHALDERIACEYILSGQADLIVNILDASNLKRNLFLTLQLLELQIPCLVVVNMMDIAAQRGIHIDLAEMQNRLGCPVLPLVCSRNEGLDELKQQLKQPLKSQRPTQLTTLPPALDAAINELTPALAAELPDQPSQQLPALALKCLENDHLALSVISAELRQRAATVRETLTQALEEDLDIVVADARYQSINTLLKQVNRSERVKKHRLTHYLDTLFLNRFLGIPLFFLVMYAVFEISIYVGGALSPLFDQGTSVIFIDGIQYLGHLWHFPAWLTAILANGLGLGINTVASFIPQIGLMFLCLSLLEDSGYMARAAFVMDRFMQAVGLPGKSFIPLIVGFGCNVPSVMAARTLESPRDRLLTILMAPFMSCGARMAIFVVFGSAFFPNDAGLIVFLLYVTGIAIAMLTGLIFKATLLKGKPAPFLLELPAYHVPSMRTMGLLSWQRLQGFIVRAGKFIVPICMIIGTLNVIQIDGRVEVNGSHQSLLSEAGRKVTPLLHPMGVDQNNWPATVGLITGLLAKEVVVGTLNTLYTQGNEGSRFDPATFDLIGGLESAVQETVSGLAGMFSSASLNPFTANEADHNMTHSAMGNMQAGFVSQAAAFAYLLFVLLYIPCVSTVGAIRREVGAGWGYLSSFWSLSIAYSVAVIFYQASLMLEQPLSASAWIVGLLVLNATWLIVLAKKADRQPISVHASTGARP